MHPCANADPLLFVRCYPMPQPAPHDEKSLATIQATLKTKEKELAVEEKLLQGATALLRASAQADQKKQAQRQVDGSQARVDQLRRDVTRLKEMEKAAMSVAAASSEANGKVCAGGRGGWAWVGWWGIVCGRKALTSFPVKHVMP